MSPKMIAVPGDSYSSVSPCHYLPQSGSPPALAACGRSLAGLASDGWLEAYYYVFGQFMSTSSLLSISQFQMICKQYPPRFLTCPPSEVHPYSSHILCRFICTDGPYKVIRHPGYMGTMLIWIGFGLAATNWFVLLFVAGLVSYGLIRRIQVEEEVLFERFGVDYQAYADETAK